MKKDKKKRVVIENLTTGKKVTKYYDLNSTPALSEKRSKLKKINPLPVNIQYLYYWQNKLNTALELHKEVNKKLGNFSDLEVLEWITETQEAGEDVRKEAKELKQEKTPIGNGKAREIIIKEETLKITNLVLGIVSYYAGYQRTGQIKLFLERIGLEPTENRIRETQRNRNFEHSQRSRKDIKTDLKSYFVSLEVSLQVMRVLKIDGRMKLRDRIKQIGEKAGFR